MAEQKGILGSLDPTGAFNAASGFLSQHIANRQQRWNIQTQNKYEQERAAKQFEYDTTAWNRQNEYNSPKEVMRRYKDAGLNPNLIYEGGVGNTAGSAPARKAPEQNMSMPTPVDISGILGNYQDARLQQVQTNNAIKQGELLDKQKLIKAAEAAAAINYYGGRGKASYSKGQEALQRWSWLRDTDDSEQSRGYSILDTQLDYKRTGINQALKRMLLLDQEIDLKKMMIRYYDFGQLMKLAGPAVGIVNKFLKGGKTAAKAAPGVKGVSSKFTPKYNTSSSWDNVQSTEF